MSVIPQLRERQAKRLGDIDAESVAVPAANALAELLHEVVEARWQTHHLAGPLEARIARARASGVPETVIAGLLEDADEVFRAGC